MLWGTDLNCITISDRFSAILLPVLRKKGTPDHLQLSIHNFRATKVSVLLSGLTPLSLRYEVIVFAFIAPSLY